MASAIIFTSFFNVLVVQQHPVLIKRTGRRNILIGQFFRTDRVVIVLYLAMESFGLQLIRRIISEHAAPPVKAPRSLMRVLHSSVE